jgi:hypothetical protein
VSSGSKARQPSNRHASVVGGVACSTEEAGQRPRREEVTQDSLFGESNTAAGQRWWIDPSLGSMAESRGHGKRGGYPSGRGRPARGPVSPVLSNVYLHYVLDLWFERRFKKTCRSFAELTRFADDYVATFQNQADAERFRHEMEERLTAFALRVAPEKTAVLHFDGGLLQRSGKQVEKPATFTFLGFVHYLTKKSPREGDPRPKAEHQGARTLCPQGQNVGQGAPARPGSQAASRPDEEAQRPLSVLWALLLHARSQQRAVPNPKALALGVAAPQPESQTPMRLANVARQAMVPAPIA